MEVYLTKELQSPDLSFSEECSFEEFQGFVYYNCFVLEPTYNTEFTKRVILTVGISNDWSRENDINLSTVVILKDGVMLPTFFVGDTPELSYFETEFDSFSVFSVYAQKNVYPTIEYWEMLDVIEDYYKKPETEGKADDALKLYYGVFEGTGTMTIHTFRDQLLKPDHIILLILISFTFLFGLTKRRKDDEKSS